MLERAQMIRVRVFIQKSWPSFDRSDQMEISPNIPARIMEKKFGLLYKRVAESRYRGQMICK